MRIPATPAWLPVWIAGGPDQPRLLWADLGGEPLREPFFDLTLERRLAAAAPLYTPIRELADRAASSPGIPPTGFIFHMSRCGSTLVARMLAALDRCVVFSEPPLLSQILGARQLAEGRRLELFRQALSCMGQRRTGNETALFVKFASWDVLHLPLVRRAFPDVPWVFVHREPLEVMVPAVAVPTGWLRARRAIASELRELVDPALDPESTTAEEVCSRVLEAFCRTALAELGPRAMILGYPRLPAAVTAELADLFGLDLSAAERFAMHEVSNFYSKDAGRAAPFVADGPRKQAAASASQRELIGRWHARTYAALARLG